MDAADPAEPDVASLFAPVAVEETFGGVLIEARQVLGALHDPVDAELWGSDLIGALASSAAGLSSLMDTLTKSLVPAAEDAASPEALALLNELYRNELRLMMNLFQPSVKLVRKVRIGSRLRRQRLSGICADAEGPWGVSGAGRAAAVE